MWAQGWWTRLIVLGGLKISKTQIYVVLEGLRYSGLKKAKAGFTTRLERARLRLLRLRIARNAVAR